MALFKIQKGLSTDLATNRPDAVEGYCYFTTDDGLFYIDTVSGTLTGDNPTGTRVLLNAGQAAYASRALKDFDGNVISETYATKEEVNSTSIVPLFYSQTINGNGTDTSFTITHNLGLTDVIIQVFDNANNATIECDCERTSANVVKVEFATAPATTKSYRVLVYGMDARLIANTEYSEAIPYSEKGAANGVVPLNGDGKIDASYLQSAASTRFKTTITGDNETTLFTVEHNLGTRDVMVQIYDVDNYETVNCGVIRQDSDNVLIRFVTAVDTSKSYKVLVIAIDDEE